MTEQSEITPACLTVEQIARRCGCSTDSIWRWKRAGRFLAAVRVGPGCTRWRLSDIEACETQIQACCMFDATFVLDALSDDEAKT